MDSSLIDAYLPRLPLLVVLLAGIVIAVKHRPAHPDVSRLALIALTIMLVVHAVDPLLSPRLSALAREQDWGPAGLGWLLTIKGAAFVLLTTLAWWLALRAAWIGRSEPAADPVETVS